MAIPNMEEVTVAEAFVFQVVSLFGVPAFLHTDQCPNFESVLLKAVEVSKADPTIRSWIV